MFCSFVAATPARAQHQEGHVSSDRGIFPPPTYPEPINCKAVGKSFPKSQSIKQQMGPSSHSLHILVFCFPRVFCCSQTRVPPTPSLALTYALAVLEEGECPVPRVQMHPNNGALAKPRGEVCFVALVMQQSWRPKTPKKRHSVENLHSRNSSQLPCCWYSLTQCQKHPCISDPSPPIPKWLVERGKLRFYNSRAQGAALKPRSGDVTVVPWQGPTPNSKGSAKSGPGEMLQGQPAAALVSLTKGFTGLVAPLVPLLPTQPPCPYYLCRKVPSCPHPFPAGCRRCGGTCPGSRLMSQSPPSGRQSRG